MRERYAKQKNLAQKIATQDWPAIISAYQSSGQTQKDFCQARDIGFSQFKRYYYGPDKKPHHNDIIQHDATTEKKEPAIFAPLKITGVPVDAPTEIRFPSGVIIKVPAQITLAAIVKALSVHL